jgi:hypothetical protein
MAKPPPRKPVRRREPPTIELSATEVHVVPQEVPPAEPEVTTAAPAAEPAPVVTEPPATPAPEIVFTAPDATQSPEPPPHTTAAPPSEPPRMDLPPPPSSSSLPARASWSLLSAVAGAATVVAVLAILWALGLIVPRDQTLAQLSGRIAALESQSSSRQPTLDAKALDDVNARIARVEATANAPRPTQPDQALIGRLGTLEVAVKSLGDAAANINGRSNEVEAALRAARERAEAMAKTLAGLQADVDRLRTSSVDKKDVERLAARLAALESSTRTVEQKIETPGSTAADRDVRMAVRATALKAAVERGTPYAAELAAIRPLIKDDAALAALDKFATTGAPTSARLGAELAAIIPTLAKAAAPQPRDGSLLERLQANATRLVKVRPIDAPAGDDADTIVQRIEAKTQRADIAGALTELAKLPPPLRAPADAWIDRAKARNATLLAAQKIAADTFGALARPAH